MLTLLATDCSLHFDNIRKISSLLIDVFTFISIKIFKKCYISAKIFTRNFFSASCGRAPTSNFDVKSRVYVDITDVA